MSNVTPLPQRPTLPKTLSRDEAKVCARDVLQDSANVIWKDHAYQRMEERGVTDMQVFQVLRRGTVIADPQWSEERNWKFTMEADTAGDIVRVGVVLDVDKMGYVIMILTVFVH